MYDALSTILIGDPNQGRKIEEIIRSLRKEGTDRHLLNLMGAAPLIDGADDLNFVTTTDLRMLARTFRTNIYMFFETNEFAQTHWDCYTGNKKGPNRGGIYLKAGMSGGTRHCFFGSFPFVPPQYVMRPPVTKHVPLHSKSLCKYIARASGGCK